MNKLLPWLLVLMPLAGAISVPQPGHDNIRTQIVGSAPASYISGLCDHVPVLKIVPGLVQRSEKLIEGYVPGLASIPGESGSTIGSIVVKAAPRFM
jgi:hypothetical protein